MNPRRKAFISWARGSAIELPPCGGHGVVPELSAEFDRLLMGKRFVYVGEADHFNLEKYGYRLMVARELFRRGWRWIGDETGRAMGRRIDYYLETGQHQYLEYKKRSSPQDVAAHGRTLDFVKDEGVRFAEPLRRISESRPAGTSRLHYFGYDTDLGGPEPAYKDIRLFLAEHKSNRFARDLLQSLERIQQDSTECQLSELDSLVREVILHEKELVGCFDEKMVDEFRQLLVSLLDSVRAVKRRRWAESPRENLKWMARRECAMLRHVMETLAQLPAKEKLILMGHNYHLSKDFTQLRAAPGQNNFWGWVPRVKSLGYSAHAVVCRYSSDWMWGCTIGTLLNTLFPEQVVSIWMLYGEGQLMGRKGPIPIGIKRDTIESLLAEVGERFLLPLEGADKQARVLLENANFRGPRGYYSSGNLCAQADALFFVRRVSASRRTAFDQVDE